MQSHLLLAATILLGTSALQAQDTISRPRTAYSLLFEQFETDDEGRASLMTVRWSKWRPGMGAFEGSAGVIRAGPGGLSGGAGGVYVVNDGPVSLLLRGGVGLLLIPAFDEVVAPVGVYGGLAMLVGTGHTNLRLELSRHEYAVRQDHVGGWMFGVGLAFTPRSGSPKGTGR